MSSLLNAEAINIEDSQDRAHEDLEVNLKNEHMICRLTSLTTC